MDPERARAQSQALWSSLAPGWDRHRRRMWDTTHSVTEWLIAQAAPRPGDTILELGCGPGDTAPLLSEAAGETGRVIETDFSPEMVAIAERFVADRSLTNAECRVMDAERMDLADESVDVVLCRWAYMLMLDPQRALRETRRVLRDGGRLAYSVWGAPDENPWVLLPAMTIRKLGHQLPGDAFGPGGIFSMADVDKVRDMTSQAGFEQVTIEKATVKWRSSSFEDDWGFMVDVAGPIATLVRQLPPDAIETYKEALRKEMEPFRSGPGYEMPGTTLNVIAS
ncbi:MAG TPA: class I SAM-dependent methyltransferase [Actinomycetota bacterium]|nr:class I SAM-dependent methyltransferase [Actinomycetota bacterium]